MKRYGGDLRKAKRILLLFTVLIAVLWLPVLWLGNEIDSSTDFFSIPITWAYTLILLPIALTVVISIARRLFEQANR